MQRLKKIGGGQTDTFIEGIYCMCCPRSAWYSELEESRNLNVYIRTNLGFNLGNIMQSIFLWILIAFLLFCSTDTWKWELLYYVTT